MTEFISAKEARKIRAEAKEKWLDAVRADGVKAVTQFEKTIDDNLRSHAKYPHGGSISYSYVLDRVLSKMECVHYRHKINGSPKLTRLDEYGDERCQFIVTQIKKALPTTLAKLEKAGYSINREDETVSF